MKKFLLPIIILLLVALIAAFSHYSVFAGQGVLQIETTPSVTVIINDENMGQTPFKKEFRAQKLDIKLVDTQDEEKVLWQGRVALNSSTISLINYTFVGDDQENYGEILTFSKIAAKDSGALLIASYPDKAVVNLDSEVKGYTPLLLEGITAGQHILELSLAGYNNTIIGINIAPGYQLNVETKLALNPQDTAEKEEDITNNQEKTVTILSTPTGWLRVRSGPGTEFEEIARVLPEEIYPLLDQEDNWLQIAVDKETPGWISATYGQINQEETN
jgi:hypothetical protein